MKKNLKILLFILLSVLFINFTEINVRADDISLAVSPSKIYNEQINYGESKKFSFYVANKSDVVNKKSLVMEIKTSLQIEDEFGRVISTKGIITCDKPNFKIDLNETAKVNVEINVPEFLKKDVPEGNYNFYITFKQVSINDKKSKNQVSAIRVPMYIFVGDKKNFESKKVDFKLVHDELDLGEKPNSIWVYSWGYIKKCFNPLNIKDSLVDILNKPIFNFGKEDKVQQIDLNNDFYDNLSNVSTCHKSLMSNKRYVYYKKDDLSKKIKKCFKNSDSITVVLSNKHVINVKCDSNELQEIYKQIVALAAEKPNVTLEKFMNYIQVPKDKTYHKTQLVLVSRIKSNSDIPIALKESFVTSKNSVTKVAQSNLVTSTVKQKEVKDVKTIIAPSNLSSGIYDVAGSYSLKNKTKSFRINFEIQKQRTIIFAIVLAFNLIYFGIIIFIIINLVKLIYKLREKWR